MDTGNLVNITHYTAVFLVVSKPVKYNNNSILNDGFVFDLSEKVNKPKSTECTVIQANYYLILLCITF